MRIWKRLACLALPAAVCLTLLVGCAGEADGVSLSVCVGSAPVTLDPIYAEETGDQTILAHLYENLMRVAVDVSGTPTVTGGMAKDVDQEEIYDGTVQVMSIAREAGSRTKLAVWSDDENVDPIGACVGPRGQRVNAVVEELRGEKVDIIKWSEDPGQYVGAALAPADVISVTELEEGKSCRVVVPDDQLSLAIGKEGQNARLAARLTGFKIDIRPASAPEPPEEAPEDAPEAADEEDIEIEE